jgi:hypothetical protein
LTPPGEIDERVDARALGAALSATLQKLSADQREVLLLHAWGGLSPAEIADALSLPDATVRKRLHHARTKAAEPRALDRARYALGMSSAAAPPSTRGRRAHRIVRVTLVAELAGIVVVVAVHLL